jgi:hypothetical protein
MPISIKIFISYQHKSHLTVQNYYYFDKFMNIQQFYVFMRKSELAIWIYDCIGDFVSTVIIWNLFCVWNEMKLDWMEKGFVFVFCMRKKGCSMMHKIWRQNIIMNW